MVTNRTVAATAAVAQFGFMIFRSLCIFCVIRGVYHFGCSESKQIGWAIYNTVGVSVIVLPLYFLLNLVGDASLLIQAFAILWIATCSLALLFAPKFINLYEQAHGGLVMSADGQSTTESNGFSFLSIVTLPEPVLSMYIVALEKQTTLAKERLAMLRKPNQNGVAPISRGAGSAKPPPSAAKKYAAGAAPAGGEAKEMVRSGGSSASLIGAASMPSQRASAAARRQSLRIAPSEPPSPKRPHGGPAALAVPQPPISPTGEESRDHAPLRPASLSNSGLLIPGMTDDELSTHATESGAVGISSAGAQQLWTPGVVQSTANAAAVAAANVTRLIASPSVSARAARSPGGQAVQPPPPPRETASPLALLTHAAISPPLKLTAPVVLSVTKPLLLAAAGGGERERERGSAAPALPVPSSDRLTD
jgi:hypothetical protein